MIVVFDLHPSHPLASHVCEFELSTISSGSYWGFLVPRRTKAHRGWPSWIMLARTKNIRRLFAPPCDPFRSNTNTIGADLLQHDRSMRERKRLTVAGPISNWPFDGLVLRATLIETRSISKSHVKATTTYATLRLLVSFFHITTMKVCIAIVYDITQSTPVNEGA